MKSKYAVAVMLVLLVAGTAAAQQTSVDYDRDADFSKYKKYAWAEGLPAQDPFNHKRIVEAIDAHWLPRGGRGLRPARTPTPWCSTGGP